MQVFIFIICALCGVLSGVVYDVLYIVRCAVCGINKRAYTLKDKIFTAACDVVYCLAFAAIFVFASVTFSFYGLRAYMFLACAAGAFLYLKSFHLIVAFSVKKVYNVITHRKGAENDAGKTD